MDAVIPTITTLIAIVAIILGTFFSIVGVLGLYRLPDVYSRLQATGKVGVLGVAFLLVAVICQVPGSLGRGLVLIMLLLIVGPAVSHALSSAAYRSNVPMESIRDDLKRDIESQQVDG
jgi:multicomponent Na+:H+ antiporter subunit G